MVSSSLDKKEDAVPRRKNVNKSLQSVSRNKPLIKYRFYLDVKNRVFANKLEVKIKELGGELELFLIKEVSHVITDREECYTSKGGGFYPRTPQCVTNESCHNDSCNNLENTPKGRPKTRADAMLERARKTTTVISKDPLEQARNWGITIWAVEKAFAWLDKVTSSVKASVKKNHKIFEFKTPYIKFEAFDRETRPVVQQIRNWPIFNIFGSVGDPGIVSRSSVERNMTRKTRSNHPRIDTAIQPGYCEVCRIEYSRLDEHLESEKHLAFIKDSSNFLQLDTFINNTANIDSFLKINGVDGIELNSISGNIHKKMPRTRTISLSDKIKNSPLSPTGSESGHRLRSRRQCSISYLSTIADDDGHLNKFQSVPETRELRSSTRQLLKLVENEQKDTWDSGRPKRTCIKQKRSSAEERLVLDNRMYYKVEVLSNKLRSSGDKIKDEPVKRSQAPPPQEHKENSKDKSLIVKFKRMRSSELKQLNNEAENFLFPKKDESSSEDDLDADGPETTASLRDGDSTLLLSSETDEPKEEVKHLDEASLDSNWSESSVKKRKRRTHAEAFISDNQKYYKFETPGSRLRYHGSYLPPITNGQKSPKHNGEYPCKITKSNEKEQSSKKDKQNVKPVKLNLEELQFSFERVPRSEPWYQTFRRQDEGQEYYTCFSDSGYWKPFLLPYQMGPIPPLDPRLCIKAYQEVKKHLFDASSASTSAGPNTPDCQDESSIDMQEDCSKTSEDSNLTANTKTDDECKFIETDQTKTKKKRRGIVISKNPRKSPRQHASTLAILSSLIHQRKRRNETNRSRSSDLNTHRQSLPSIPEVNKDKKHSAKEEADYDRIAKSMDEVLSSMNDLDYLEISSDENMLIDMNRKLSAIDILEDYDKMQRDNLSNPTKTYVSGKKPGRKKKKKNRTGWPNKNKRKKGNETLKEEEPDDNSTVDSMSVNADSDFNEDNCDEGTEDMNGGVANINKNNCANRINSSTDQSNNGVQLNISTSANVQTSVVATTTENNLKQDRVNTVYISDNCKDKMCDKGLNDRIVDLERWESAEKVLSAKVTNSELNKDIQFQPYVRVQKLDSSGASAKKSNRRLRNSSSPHRTVKRPRRTPASPKSPRILRKPRGRWYRER